MAEPEFDYLFFKPSVYALPFNVQSNRLREYLYFRRVRNSLPAQIRSLNVLKMMKTEKG